MGSLPGKESWIYIISGTLTMNSFLNYNFIFYCYYKHYKDVYEFSRDWPEAWASIFLSMLLSFIAMMIDSWIYFFFKFELLSFIGDMLSFGLISHRYSSAWLIAVLLIANFYYFVFNKNWIQIVEQFSKLPKSEFENNKKIVYGMSFLIFVSFLMSAVM